MANLSFIYSSMNSGKSLSLLTKHHMLSSRGFSVIIAKPVVDTRDEGVIKTRLGIEKECLLIDTLLSKEILKSKKKKPDFILIDEAQFLSKEQVWDLATMVDNWNIEIICYGLRINWKGEFFTGSEELFKIADYLYPIENYCKHEKGKLAYFHIKLSGSDSDVELGYENMYDTVSRKYWLENKN
jgi:thymidine kinase